MTAEQRAVIQRFEQSRKERLQDAKTQEAGDQVHKATTIYHGNN